MLIRVSLALAMSTCAVAQNRTCTSAPFLSSAQLGEQGQAAGALNAQPACQRIHIPELKNVFIARVIRIENRDGEINVDGECAKTLLQTVHLQIREQLVGKVDSTVVLSAGDLNGYYFKTGKVYLVYAETLKDGSLHVSGYGQTKPIVEAANDLAYIRSYARHPSGSEIFGHAWAAANPRIATQMVGWPVRPMKGLRVTLQGDSSYEAITGPDGKYKMNDLPPGKYVVSIEVKSAVWPSPSQTVDVTDKGCAEVNFNVDPFRTQDGALIKPKP